MLDQEMAVAVDERFRHPVPAAATSGEQQTGRRGRHVAHVSAACQGVSLHERAGHRAVARSPGMEHKFEKLSYPRSRL
jgi:hypothetical protein